MEAGISAARQARTQHRHELRTLTYVTLDHANGGIVRNLSHQGIGVQLVAGVRPRQQLRVRFELRYPRLRVEARGEVVWATFSGQCGIRFLDMPRRMIRHVDEWIFGDLLECAALHAEPDARSSIDEAAAQDDGLLLSAVPRKVIQLRLRPETAQPGPVPDEAAQKLSDVVELDWLSQPLTGRSLAWTVNALVVFAALLLFALVFLSVTREAPRWPLRMAGGAAAVVAALYWGFFHMFGGSSLGARLARLAALDQEDEEEATARFR
jgi:PilZ domain